MRKNERKTRRNLLVGRANKLTREGYSVIPIEGDGSSTEPKRPTVKWRAFQNRRAEGSELEQLFDDRAGALGIVCGRVSRLLVLDFDDHLRYQRFCRHLPQYAESFTVKTRRGYHVYFRTDVKVPTHQLEGGDIKGEKSYVVAPPSVIGGWKYQAIKKAAAMEIEAEDVDRILGYFQVRSSGAAAVGGRVCEPGIVEIAAMYEAWSGTMGRNNALYRCACAGRDQGMSRSEVEEKLLGAHVMARGYASGKVETAAERYREGVRTIASAFAKARRLPGGAGWHSESVRERLLQAQGSAVTARVLDMMVLAGWQAESFFRMSDAIEVGEKYGLNRKSVMAALTGEFSSFDGRHIICRRYVEYLDIGGLKLGKRGRPVQLVFQAPSVARLLSVLRVGASPSDRLCKEDVLSSHAYRRALHREYVKRLSPDAPMRVLAARLGVDARTLRRYNAQLGVQACERVGRFELTWEKLKCLPRRERNAVRNQTPGYWLTVGEGARFPAWRHIGMSLLRGAVGPVQVCAQLASVRVLGKGFVRSVAYESMSVEEFLRLRIVRDGEVAADGAGLLGRLRGAVREARQRAAGFVYEKIPMEYGNVARLIAEDKVAETISGYLVAEDAAGSQVRRPARRGVAYRMLKEFGEGRVYLAIRESYRELMAALAGHALHAGRSDAGLGWLARSGA